MTQAQDALFMAILSMDAYKDLMLPVTISNKSRWREIACHWWGGAVYDYGPALLLLCFAAATARVAANRDFGQFVTYAALPGTVLLMADLLFRWRQVVGFIFIDVTLFGRMLLASAYVANWVPFVIFIYVVPLNCSGTVYRPTRSLILSAMCVASYLVTFLYVAHYVEMDMGV
jgi:cell division protein FtsW (lipid II flippase)